jgi:N6-adenosine-specific RNA methylase IME4
MAEIIEQELAEAANYINESWRNGVENIIETGHRLIETRQRFHNQPGMWSRLIGANQWDGRGLLSFARTHAKRLIVIAEAIDRLGPHVGLLPSDIYTLFELSRLSNERFAELLDAGAIHPGMKRNDASAETRRERQTADEARVLKLAPGPGKYRTLVLDPAWDYDWLSIAGRAKPGYAMQSHDDLLELDVRAWADEEFGCHLYLWTTNNFMGRACELVAHWGFQHRTLITWVKPPPFGLGSYFRNSTEHVLFATLGDTTTRAAAASIPTHFEAARGEHSEKPERFYEIVRAASYPPYGEGNQREPRSDFANLYCPVTDASEDCTPEVVTAH